VTPKVSLQYYFTPDDLIYATASEGFRAGGVNQALTSATAGTLAQYGLTEAVFPKTYRSDSVWSYELGSKTRLWDGRAQINADIYDLQWKNVQTFYFTGDGAVFNVPTARSRGAELEAQVRPFRPLTLSAALAYIKAEYTSSLAIAAGPGSRAGNLVIAQDGQAFAQPPGPPILVPAMRSPSGLLEWVCPHRLSPVPGLSDCRGRHQYVLAGLEQHPRTAECRFAYWLRARRIRCESVRLELNGRVQWSRNRRPFPVHRCRLQHL